MNREHQHEHECGHRCWCALPAAPDCVDHALQAATSDAERETIARERWPADHPHPHPEALAGMLAHYGRQP